MGKPQPIVAGQIFGFLKVKERAGSSKSGDILYRCTCLRCGNEHTVPACSLRNGSTRSCGCLQRASIASQTQKGVQANIIDGVNVANATKTTPNKNNKTGYRGVHYSTRRKYFVATVQIGGEKWIKWGFKSAEEAKAARDEKHKELMKKHFPS